VGLSEKLRSSRVKMFCPKCDEVYMLQKAKSSGGVQTATNLDGAYFGSSFPHIFMATFDNLIEQPPKVYYYEPSISGFKVAGQRGSKYFMPPAISVYQKPLSLRTCYT
jgi:casein kinase II subunit beta